MRRPELKDARVPMPVLGEIKGSGDRLTLGERQELIRLRESNPEVFSLRRLAAIYGLDVSSVHWILRGGRKGQKRRGRR